MISRIRRAWRAFKGPETHSAEEVREAPQSPLPEYARRWDAAQTHRLNQAHWQHAIGGRHINDDLASHLEVIRARSTYEAFTNPMVEGVIKTHCIDLITPTGPTLVVESENETYNKRFKEAWDAWCECPEITGELSWLDLLRRWNWQTWTKGPILAHWVTDNMATSDTFVKLRIQDIDPNRLETPPQMHGKPDVFLGVERDGKGRKKRFWIRDEVSINPSYRARYQYTELAAEQVLFAFQSFEPGQAVGFPRLSSCLEEIAQLRDYDMEVLDAAKQFANMAAYFYTENDLIITQHSSDKLPSGSVDMKRAVGRYLKPGWKAEGMQSQQPMVGYIDYRHEKLRALGRSVHMPLLLILLSAQKSNFSQSKIDVNVLYQRGLKSEHQWWNRHVCNPTVNQFRMELQLVRRGGQFYLPPAPRDLRFRWHWEPISQADEYKYWNSKILQRQLGVTTFTQDCAEVGLDPHRQAALIASDGEILEEAGLPPIPGTTDSADNSDGESGSSISRANSEAAA